MVLADGTSLLIRHLVLEGSGECSIGSNFTSSSIVIHLYDNYIIIPGPDSMRVAIRLIDNDDHLYLPCTLLENKSSTTNIDGLTASSGLSALWMETWRTICKARNHVRGHSSFGEMHSLRAGNGLWSTDDAKYIVDAVARCTKCSATARPQPRRKI